MMAQFFLLAAVFGLVGICDWVLSVGPALIIQLLQVLA